MVLLAQTFLRGMIDTCRSYGYACTVAVVSMKLFIDKKLDKELWHCNSNQGHNNVSH